MRKKILSIFIAIILLSICAVAQGGKKYTVWSKIDDRCRRHIGKFKIPNDAQGVKFNFNLTTTWMPCSGTGTPSRIGFRILGANKNVLYYYVKYYKGKSKELVGNIKNLSLGPGKYFVDVSDGGKSTKVALSYEIKKAGKPKMNISGSWTDPGTKSKTKIIQNGDKITIINSFILKGKVVEWKGSGKITGNHINIKFWYTKNRPKGWENGVMQLKLYGNNKIAGKWIASSKKYSGSIRFEKKDSKKPKSTKYKGKTIKRKPPPKYLKKEER